MSKIKNITFGIIGAVFTIGSFSSQASEFTTYTSSNDKADITKYKSYAQIRSIYEHFTIPFCGASIYSDTLIITAAHCLYTKKSDATYVNDSVLDGVLIPSVYELRDLNSFGITVKNPTRDDVSKSEVKKVKSIYVHPSFTHKDSQVGALQSQMIYDIAIIELETPIFQIDNVESITLPANRDYNVADSKFDLVGLGYARNETAPTYLQHTTATINADSLCYWFELDGTDEKVLCTDSVTENGDSGGPLFYENSNGKQVQVGIVNSGDYLNSNFTEVFNYVQWINDVINNQGFAVGSPLFYDDSILDLNEYHSFGDTGYIAKPTQPTIPDDNTPDEVPSSSGGSANIFSIIGICLVALFRKKIIKLN